MKFELTVLGSGSALPRLDRKPSAQLLNVQEHYFLIDCGEGTQLELKRHGIKFQRIERIFISHLHGDHYLGLMGLLATFHLLGREKDLHIHAAPELEQILDHQMELTGTFLRFPLHFHPTRKDHPERIFENEKLLVTSFPLEHGIHCNGFLIQERPKKRKIRKEKLDEYDIPIQERPRLKEGEDVHDREGQLIPCKEVTYPPPPSHSYAYCSDTAYSEALSDHVRGVDLLYHDATFLEELKERAKKTGHSTARQAARFALNTNAGRLLLGHFSARYRDLTPFIDEASTLFSNVSVAYDGMRIRLDHSED
ncbi:MAG: ribonuclease Z [Flavobacteriales bacterium]